MYTNEINAFVNAFANADGWCKEEVICYVFLNEINAFVNAFANADG